MRDDSGGGDGEQWIWRNKVGKLKILNKKGQKVLLHRLNIKT